MNIILVDDSKTSGYWSAKSLAGPNAIEGDNSENHLEHLSEDCFPQELARLQKGDPKPEGTQNVGFFSPSMEYIALQALKYHTDRSIPVLIEGETGTGKELIALMIHNGNDLCEKPFMAINCAAMSPSLFESELFGYEAGAYTGSLSKGHKGKMDLAQGGTLFLDEIGEIPQELQAKLLRVIQEKEFFRVGGLEKIKTDIRIICATNIDLDERMKNGTFRKDLYYRLKVGHLQLPPLRQRAEDILPLTVLFLEQFSREKRKRFRSVATDAAEILLAYGWPGNVRELRNVMEWVVFMYNDDEVKANHLGILGHPAVSDIGGNALSPAIADPYEFSIPQEGFSLDEFIDRIVMRALEMHRGNRAAAARMLGMTRKAFCGRLDKETAKFSMV